MRTQILIIKLLAVVLLFSCSNDDLTYAKVTDYFPLRNGNEWTYKVERVMEDGQIFPMPTEKWRVNSNLFLDIYEVTSDGEEQHQGYRVFYLKNLIEIENNMGTFLSVKYVNYPNDSLVLLSSKIVVNNLRERWIKTGINTLNTSFGKLECIYTKTTTHHNSWPYDWDYYFCKNVGIYLYEEKLTYDHNSNSYVNFTLRHTLIDYQIK